MKPTIDLLTKLHLRFVNGRRNYEDRVLINVFKKFVKLDSKILDVGCGLGHNLELLKKNGFLHAVGTDISEEMLTSTREKGLTAYTPTELKDHQDFDVLLFSHVLEHIEYRDLQRTLEEYFKLTNRSAIVVICMPLLYDGFYNDVDHIKPYYAKGLEALFSTQAIPKQYISKYCLSLLDMRYLRASLVPYHLRSRHIRTTINYLVLILLTIFFKALQTVSLGLASKVVSYIAVFKLESPIPSKAKANEG